MQYVTSIIVKLLRKKNKIIKNKKEVYLSVLIESEKELI